MASCEGDGRNGTDGDFSSRRSALVRSLRLDITDERVLRAIAEVPRERFVSQELAELAYMDRPLPIGHGQTTSQPRMIALMLQELGLKGEEKVLEVGSGSGYQTALLAKLAREVVSVELIPELAGRAGRVLRELGFENVKVMVATAELGWPALAPYDAIVVAAAAPRIPQSLVDQLAEGGRLVIPVGSMQGQDLMVAERRPEGIQVTRKGGCRFVPLIGPEAYPSAESI
jgi:protein-L-isoaspartate(D-aspartate) O-methyltransferase